MGCSLTRPHYAILRLPWHGVSWDVSFYRCVMSDNSAVSRQAPLCRETVVGSPVFWARIVALGVISRSSGSASQSTHTTSNAVDLVR
jgi:hypothetical protein